MILSDGDIKNAISYGRISISPYNDKQLNPASYDVLLGTSFGAYHPDLKYHNMEEDQNDKLVWFHHLSQYVLRPGDFVLAEIEEDVRLDDNICARIEGKSSVGRLGLLVHVTAGYVDPGWSGRLTLEIANLSPVIIPLIPGKPIAQLSFHEMTSRANRPYQGNYQHAGGVSASRYHKNFAEVR